MSEIRARFERREQIKYIAHLDIMKVFERALRRSGLPVSYTKGFNPHPELVFGLPLSLGLVSLAEYADFKFDSQVAPEDFIKRLNAQLPAGLLITIAKPKLSRENIMASIELAEYAICVCGCPEMGKMSLQGRLDDFMAIGAMPVEKETKSGKSVVDIKPMIKSIMIGSGRNYDSHVCSANDDSHVCSANDDSHVCSANDRSYEMRVRVSAGSRGNLKPDTLFSAMRVHGGFTGDIGRVCRTGLYVKKGSEYLDPLDEKVI